MVLVCTPPGLTPARCSPGDLQNPSELLDIGTEPMNSHSVSHRNGDIERDGLLPFDDSARKNT